MKRFPLASKIILLVILILLMLLPIGAITDLIHERSSYRQSVIQQVASSTSAAQTIVGPVLVFPYEKTELSEADDNGKRRYSTRNGAYYLLPETLDIAATAQVEARKLGIYQAQVYDSHATLQGRFIVTPSAEWGLGDIKVGQPYLSVGIADMRGIRQVSPLTLNGKEIAFRPSAKINAMEQGLHAMLDNLPPTGKTSQPLPFSFELELLGTSNLSVVPVGETTNFSLKSNWPHPNFIGSFLPTQRTVSDQGFSAQWSSTWFANNMNQRLVQAFNAGAVWQLPAFSATMIETVDQYQLSDRSVKYAILFIGLTFVAFFLFEMLKALRVHPIQYLLVSVALSLFYLLLLALSEHIGFNLAYLAAALACTGLITYYVSYVLGSIQRGIGFGALLALLYAALWGLLQSEDNALLLGSLLLTVVLALVMALTRKIDWYRLGASADQSEGKTESK
ncbi:MAG: cell envelope integrity protein CreD [Betaproteobacteria bacterium]|nr:cell envelope integrity protein CreD [Betaproteobacteria bacterium]